MLVPPLKAIPAACLVLLAAVVPAAAEDGVSADKILFGQAAALAGPAGALGQVCVPKTISEFIR
jgi:branched-chain amino acid transport system substrate-binding protein